MSVEMRLAEMSAALVRVGLGTPTAPSGTQDLVTAVRAIAPMSLPPGARRLWELVDAATYPVETFPSLITPAEALSVWQGNRPELAPARLFPIGYTSWSHLLVELDTPDQRDGGALFEWMYGGADFELAYDDVEDWLSFQTQEITRGNTERFGERLRIVDQGARPLATRGLARLERRGPHPVWGTTTSVPERFWPERWRWEPPGRC